MCKYLYLKVYGKLKTEGDKIKKHVLLAVVTMLIFCSLYCGCLDGSDKNSNNKYNGPPEFQDLTYSPLEISPGDKISVDATVENTSSMRIDVETMYITGSSVAHLNQVMEKINDKHYRYTFSAPTEDNVMWCVARAQNKENISVEDMVMPVGNMTSNEIEIKNVSHTPKNPTAEDGKVKVFFELENDTEIDVYEGYSVGAVEVQYGVFGLNFHGSNPVDVVEYEENKFYANLTYDDFGINVKGLPLVYKIFAEDTHGEIGYSQTYELEIE